MRLVSLPFLCNWSLRSEESCWTWETCWWFRSQLVGRLGKFQRQDAIELNTLGTQFAAGQVDDSASSQAKPLSMFLQSALLRQRRTILEDTCLGQDELCSHDTCLSLTDLMKKEKKRSRAPR